MKLKTHFLLWITPLLILAAACGRKETEPAPSTDHMVVLEAEVDDENAVLFMETPPIVLADVESGVALLVPTLLIPESYPSDEVPPPPALHDILSEEKTPTGVNIVAVSSTPAKDILQHYQTELSTSGWVPEFSYQRGTIYNAQYQKADRQVRIHLQPASGKHDPSHTQLTFTFERTATEPDATHDTP